jgi:hypothetical protein
MTRQTLCLAAVLLSTCAAFSADTPPAPVAQPDLKKIDAWVKSLGSDDFKEREDATTALKDAGQAAKPALEAALASSKDAEVNSRVTKLLDYLKPFLTLAMLNDAERAVAKMALPELEEGAEEADIVEYEAKGYYLTDIGNIRIAIKGGRQSSGGRSSSTIEINSQSTSIGSGSSTGNGRTTSTAYANGVSTITTPEITFTISRGVMTIDGQKVKFEKTAKVLFVDEKGKLEKLYDFGKDVETKSTPSAEQKK